MIIKYIVYLYIGEEVDKGKVKYKAFFGTHEMAEKTFDLCSNLSPVNLSCPFHPGKYMIVCCITL